MTNTQKAKPSDFLKIDGNVSPLVRGWGDAGSAIDDKLHFAQWSAAMNDTAHLWHRSYSDVMVAGPMLTLDSKRLLAWSASHDRHPRTLIGAKVDGTIVMMVIDGRRKDAAGMSFPELSYMASVLGINNCINLDGGGSSAMWVEGHGIVNKPSDKVLFLAIP